MENENMKGAGHRWQRIQSAFLYVLSAIISGQN